MDMTDDKTFNNEVNYVLEYPEQTFKIKAHSTGV